MSLVVTQLFSAVLVYCSFHLGSCSRDRKWSFEAIQEEEEWNSPTLSAATRHHLHKPLWIKMKQQLKNSALEGAHWAGHSPLQTTYITLRSSRCRNWGKNSQTFFVFVLCNSAIYMGMCARAHLQVLLAVISYVIHVEMSFRDDYW